MKKKLEFMGEAADRKTKKLQQDSEGSLNMTAQHSLHSLISEKYISKEAMLHIAVRKGNLEAVKRLAEEGANLEAKTLWGATSLYS